MPTSAARAPTLPHRNGDHPDILIDDGVHDVGNVKARLKARLLPVRQENNVAPRVDVEGLKHLGVSDHIRLRCPHPDESS